ncbi:hypothetical protein PHYSODRAFT_284949 [Phytophthora sojae]|uniref:Uncharacterized protein n=1 Tax=Phytophthora sojae (strain P6497) TaxID=1094619 RepID=G4YZE9_PHYSP|nr:hypothetical protein PHYSODRAFT_284949 [Phytophthora sojae]EGZ24624.1 hypothetical protein PHYSODRAFT_284949 [Phytophthora sojae]|eukprot:XP_009519912.1 hypothetical protein PHYSODRAFT_284949 [Phytophthora sojae]
MVQVECGLTTAWAVLTAEFFHILRLPPLSPLLAFDPSRPFLSCASLWPRRLPYFPLSRSVCPISRAATHPQR